jgi:hypothetical protein
MKISQKISIRRVTLFGCALVLCALIASSFVSGQSISEIQKPTDQDPQDQRANLWWEPNPSPGITFSPVVNFSTHAIVPASGSILVRNRDNVFATMHTTGLTPGTAVTLWWAIFNNPHNCATRPCTPADLSNPSVQGSVASAGGKIIGADGAATFGAFRAVGDKTGVFPGIGTAEGLLNGTRAEIHLVTRTHGQANLNDPVMLNEQLSLFNGGCPPNICTNLQASIHRP